MAYEPYITTEEYRDLYPDGPEASEQTLRQVSRHIDSLTFNRIVEAGFANLTEFQQELIKEVAARQTAFEVENADLISSVLSSYSINGVSMNFGGDSWNVFTEAGVAMQRDVYSLLMQTGLCCRVLR